MAKYITPRQQEVLDALQRILDREDKPTFRALASECGFHLTYVYITVLSLEKKGKIKREPLKHGTLELA